ncbi:MAG TPA: cation:dicarboxylase symporter family transporter [Vicinamibacterales bacterium]|jgi:Na+/H+-dicarboxylate symporter|nr:cation:dicarboxylase symporter family transporter [Vicinamibacterales bacterium]
MPTSLTSRVLIALAAGVAAGLVVRAYPATSLPTLVAVIEPIGTLWVNVIRMTVIPLVGSLLIVGIAASTDLQSVRSVGLRTLATFLTLLITFAIISLVAVPPMFAWLHVDAATVASIRGTTNALVPPADVPSLRDWILGIVPANPIKAAADSLLLPVVVFAIASGLGLLTIAAERREAVLTLLRGIGDTMLAIVRAAIALAPVGVFALIVPVVSRTGLAAAGALAYYVVVTVVAQSLFIALLYPIVAIAGRVPVLRFARAVLPSQAVAIASSSSLASLPALLEGAEHGLRLPSQVSSVVLPLAVSTFKVSAPVLWPIAALSLGHLYGVPLSATQLVVIVLTSVLTSFSTPGVPHGWLLGLTPLVTTMGVPAEGIGLLIAVDAIPDIFATTLNVTGDMVAATIVSSRETPQVADRR